MLWQGGTGPLAGLYRDLHVSLSAIVHSTIADNYPPPDEIFDTLVRRTEIYFLRHPDQQPDASAQGKSKNN